MTNTRNGRRYLSENLLESLPWRSRLKQTFLIRSQPTSKRSTRRIKQALFLTTGTMTLLTYKSVRDWYYNFPITHGTAFPADTFVETEDYAILQEKLKRDYKEKSNRIVVVGESGVGKTSAVEQAYTHTISWFRRGWLNRNSEPWLKMWLSIPHEEYASNNVDQIVRESLLELAKKVDAETNAPIDPWGWINCINNPQKFFDSIGAWPLKQMRDRLPWDWQPSFIQPFKFIHDQEETMLENLRHYLERRPGWVIVVDNLQRQNAFDKFLPSKGGIIIITTNNADTSLAQDNIIEFTPLNREEGRQIVTKILGERTEKDIDALVKKMDGLPLGIAQACGYIRGTETNIKNYLELLEKHPIRMFKYKTALTREHPNLVRTLELTLNHLKKGKEQNRFIRKISSFLFDTQTSEETLLSIMTLFAPQEVPAELLRSTFDSIMQNKDSMLFDSAAGTLRQFNIIDRNQSGKQFKIHSLKHHIFQELMRHKTIDAPPFFSLDNFSFYFRKNTTLLDAVMQSFTLDKIKSHTFLPLIHALYIENILGKASKKRYSKGSHSHTRLLFFIQGSLDTLHEILGHQQMAELSKQLNLSITQDQRKDLEQKITRLEEILKYCEKTKSLHQTDLVITLKNLGHAYGSLGNYEKMRACLERVLKIKEISHGIEHIEIVKVLNELDYAYRLLSKHEKARDLLERALKIQEIFYGAEHIEMANTLNNLANAYGALGKHAKARDLLARALKIQETHYGVEHVAMAGTLNNLGNTYGSLGKHAERRDLLARALKIHEAFYGAEHVVVARTLNNLGNAYGSLGEHEKACDLLTRALKIEEAFYGKEHIEVVGTINNLGAAYGSLGKHAEERDLLARVLKIKETFYGEEHVKVADALYHLGNVYGSLGEYTKMLDLSMRALKIKEAFYGAEHVEVTDALYVLGTAYGLLGNHAKARDLFMRTLKIKEAFYGAEHVEIAETLYNLGTTYGSLGNNAKACYLLARALKIKEAFYGVEHIETAKILYNLGTAYRSLGKNEKARDLLERALKIEETYYGKKHIKVASILNNLANSYRSLGEPAKMCDCLERMLKIQEAYYGAEHIEVANTQNNLGNAYRLLGNHEKECNLLEYALKTKENYYGTGHVEVVNILNNLGTAYGSLGNHVKAGELLVRALKIQETYYGEDYVKIALILNNLGSTYRSLGNIKESRKHLERAYKILINSSYHGEQHPYTQMVARQLSSLPSSSNLLPSVYEAPLTLFSMFALKRTVKTTLQDELNLEKIERVFTQKKR